MKKRKLLLAILFLLSSQLFPQEGIEGKKDKIRTLKVGFITNALALTPDEASKFWPIYNANDKKQLEIRHQKTKSIKCRLESDLGKMTEKEASALLVQLENNEDQLYQIRKKYVATLRTILPAAKIIQLKKAEEDFNRKLLQQYRDKGTK